MKHDIDPENIVNLFSENSSNKMLLRAFRILNISKDGWGKNMAILVICSIPTIVISMSIDTVTLFHTSAEQILNVTLALFGIVFTGYAFFQALINNELLMRMLASTNDQKDKKKNGKKISKLQETNENFVELMMMILLLFTITLLLKIVIAAVPTDFVLFNNTCYNNCSAGIFIEIYFAFSTTIIWEVKSFIFNIFQLFNAHAGARAIEIIDSQSENDTE